MAGETEEKERDVNAATDTDGHAPVAEDEASTGETAAPGDDEAAEGSDPAPSDVDAPPGDAAENNAAAEPAEKAAADTPEGAGPTEDDAARKKAAEKAAMLARMRERKARHRAMTAPLWAMAEKAVAATFLLVLLFYFGHAWWVSHRQASFRSEVQAEVNKPDGIDKLRFIDDWRVQDVAPGTKRVSRGGGKYVVFVWRLPDGKYMVDSVDR